MSTVRGSASCSHIICIHVHMAYLSNAHGMEHHPNAGFCGVSAPRAEVVEDMLQEAGIAKSVC